MLKHSESNCVSKEKVEKNVSGFFLIIATKYVLITYLQPNIFFYSLAQTRYSPVYVSSYFHREVHLIPDRTRANVLKPDPQQLQPEARRS